jgi:hypothetical protein
MKREHFFSSLFGGEPLWRRQWGTGGIKHMDGNTLTPSGLR